MKFVHLHCHSHYSLLDGANRLPELAAHVKAQGMNALALTDHGNLYGAVEFYQECRAAGLNPITAYEAYVAPGTRSRPGPARRRDACAEGAVRIAARLGRPLVATCDAHYLRREDANAHDVLLCINTNSKRSDEKRMRYGEPGANTLVDQFYVRPPEEMYSLFPGREE